jgi:hypothetical protein
MTGTLNVWYVAQPLAKIAITEMAHFALLFRRIIRPIMPTC